MSMIFEVHIKALEKTGQASVINEEGHVVEVHHSPATGFV